MWAVVVDTKEVQGWRLSFALGQHDKGVFYDSSIFFIWHKWVVIIILNAYPKISLNSDFVFVSCAWLMMYQTQILIKQ